MPAAIEDLEMTVRRLIELARDQRSSELSRLLKLSIWNRAVPAAEEPLVAGEA